MELFFGSEREMYFMISDRLNGLIHYPIMVLDTVGDLKNELMSVWIMASEKDSQVFCLI